jgi:3-deoxy-D-manno-octulosonic-acid transferase
LVLDCIGLLSSAYRYGTIAFIGGGFSGSLHNILEPAVYGLPILFGPKHSKFPEAAMFLEKEFAREVVDDKTFVQCFQELLSGHQKRSQNMMALIHSQSGMAKRIAENMSNN